MVTTSARTGGTTVVLGQTIPRTSFTGVFSAIANLCLICIVVFYSSTGFKVALALSIYQFALTLNGFMRGMSFEALAGLFASVVTIATIIIIFNRNRKIEQYKEVEIESANARQRFSQRLFEQTATSLVNAIDAKDTYSHGHSLRVAEYSQRIAAELGKDEDECYRIYYAALLHDVGKIGISDSIIGKKGRLTPEEYDEIKQHPVMGNQILSSINEYPYLSIGAHFHHERYDGKGYPDGLKGEDIPEIARIISVADAYDAMSSNRSYRSAIPQQIVREEIVKNAGTQFDPEIAKIMQHLIDVDTEYRMKERDMVNELAGRNELECKEFGSDISDGIRITEQITKIHMEAALTEANLGSGYGPALILFDSLDGRVHEDEKLAKELNYFEYCEIRTDGRAVNKGVRDILVNVTSSSDAHDSDPAAKRMIRYDIEACKYKDHVLIRIDDKENITEITVALPDSSRYVYISLTGEHCHISDVSITKDSRVIGEDYITRIVDEISYIDGPEGDIPNIQIDGPRSDHTAGIPIKDILSLSFHTMSLPTARLIWHCPYFVIFSSKDGLVNGEDYVEHALIRLDGEISQPPEGAASKDANAIEIEKADSFEGWDFWKEMNRSGYNCLALFEKKGDTVTVTTENLGMHIKATAKIADATGKVYAAITGDQCAITDICVK